MYNYMITKKVIIILSKWKMALKTPLLVLVKENSKQFEMSQNDIRWHYTDDDNELQRQASHCAYPEHSILWSVYIHAILRIS